MSNEAGKEGVTPGSFSTCVRFTEVEYRRMKRDQLLTGRSIPWLLKTRYFSDSALSPPAFDYETSRQILRLHAGLCNNINQIAKAVNSGIQGDVIARLDALLSTSNQIRDLALRDYGSR